MDRFDKPFLSPESQVDLLESRGLVVTDKAKAQQVLRRIGYYRLSAYWYPFRKFGPGNVIDGRVKRLDQFVDGATFDAVYALYVFDKRLRLHLLDALERVEIALRVAVVDQVGRHDPFAHTNKALLHPRFTEPRPGSGGRSTYDDWITRLDQLVKKSKEDFVAHYQRKYGSELPIWVCSELWDFGMLSTFFQGMRVPDRIAIARRYGLSEWMVFESWIRTLNALRNIVAHHARLWNRNFVMQPKLPATADVSLGDIRGSSAPGSRLYTQLCILLHLMKAIYPASKWGRSLRQLVVAFPSAVKVSRADMGFPLDWESSPLWM